MSTDGLSQIEKNIVRLATPLENYGTLTEAFDAIADAREYQMKDWPEVGTTDAGGRPHEEWILLMQRGQNKLVDVYYETPNTPAGRARLLKYAAIQANFALWLVQSYAGEVGDDKRIQAGISAIRAAKPGETVTVIDDESGFSSGAGFAAATK